jgi:fibronectin type 3 domain-containing protein
MSPKRPKLVLCLLLLATSLVSCRNHRHSVTLTWQAPPPTTGVSVVGYNVYRRAQSDATRIKVASRVTGTDYEDQLVVSGHTYFYVVTAVDQSGRESRFSGEIQATIP